MRRNINPYLDIPEMSHIVINQHQGISDTSFKFTINTALGTGTTLTLPLPSGPTYNFWWNPGDGSAERHVTAYNDANATYDYGVTFNGQVSVGTHSGDKCGGWSFNNGGDKLKVVSVDNWGDVGFDYLVSAFFGCFNLANLPNAPIPYSGNITSLNLAFFNCRALVDFPEITLSLLTNLASVEYMCKNCFDLENIYSNMFRYNPIISFQQTFYENTSLVNLPEDLFYYNINATVYTDTFNNNRNMILPTRLFNLANLSIVTSFTGFMQQSNTAYSSTGTIQDIWNYALSATHTNAFLNQTAITNYADIPNDWKGL